MTAVVALPLLILLVFKGGEFPFACFIALVSALGLAEFYRMALPDRKVESCLACVIGAVITLVPLYASAHLFPLLTALILLTAAVLLFRFNDIRRAATEWALLAAGFLYVPLLLSQLLLVRSEPHGVSWILLMLVIVMSGDSAAYYVGSTLGRHRLYPEVSPKKSVEGALGGLGGSILGAFIAKQLFFPQLGSMDCVATALLLGVLGQMGDLFESLLKRSCGVKDSGVIVPGHGGILDRLDSILFAAPAAYWYSHYIFPLAV